MRYIEIDARNYWWTEKDDKELERIKKRARNEFVKKWLDTTYKRHIINDIKEVDLLMPTPELLNNPSTPDWIKKASEKDENIYYHAVYHEPVEHWVDYMNTLPARPIKMSISQIVENVKKWDEQKIKAASIGKIEKVMKIGSLTWYSLLDKNALQYESKYMKHCVGKDGMGYADQVEDGITQIYSLRDSNNIPHVTIEVTDHELYQVKGNSNKPFKPEYRKPVVDFLNTLDDVILQTDDILEDLINNGIFIQDGKAILLNEMKIDFNKPISEQLCQVLIQENKLPNKVKVAGYSAISIDKLDHDLEIDCDYLYIASGNNIKLKINANNIHIKDFSGSITGKANFVRLGNCNVDYDIKETSNVELEFCTIKTKEIVTTRFNCFKSEVKGKVVARPTITEHYIHKSTFDTLDIETKEKFEIDNCKIKNFIYKGKKLILDKTKIFKMKIDAQYLIILNQDMVLDNVDVETLEIQFCTPKIKNVKTKRLRLNKTKLTEADFGL